MSTKRLARGLVDTVTTNNTSGGTFPNRQFQPSWDVPQTDSEPEVAGGESRTRWAVGFVVGIASLAVAVVAFLWPLLSGTHEVPKGIQGQWTGVAQSSSAVYTVDLRLKDGGVGDEVGSLLIPEYGCRFSLVLNQAYGDTIEVQIEVEYGYPNCVGGRGAFELRSGGLWYGVSATTGEQVTTILHHGATDN